MKVLILRGLPGSGKSTYATKLATQEPCFIYSADHYFEDGEGGYNFDRTKLGQAHAYCMRLFLNQISKSMRERVGVVGGFYSTLIVDNTNATLVELAPYVAVANAYNIPWKILTFECDPVTSIERNTHGVPEQTIRRMHDNMRNADRRFPKHWKNNHKVIK